MGVEWVDSRTVVLFSSMFVLGATHGLGPDHCVAVAALGARRGPGAVLRVALRFGAAHAATLLLAVLVLRLAGGVIPLRVERAAEVANGLLLLLLGLALVSERGGELLRLHAHAHRGDGGASPQGRTAFATGALFALSGIRSTVLALPVALERSVPMAMAALCLFGAGVLASMAAYGVALSFAQSAAQRRGLSERGLRVVLGAASATFGCYWLAHA